MNLSKPVKLHSALKCIEIYYANADDIGIIIQPVKIKHMANHS